MHGKAGILPPAAPRERTHADHSSPPGQRPDDHPSDDALTADETDTAAFLSHCDDGRVSTTGDGRTLRQWDVNTLDKESEVAPSAWVFCLHSAGENPVAAAAAGRQGEVNRV